MISPDGFRKLDMASTSAAADEFAETGELMDELSPDVLERLGRRGWGAYFNEPLLNSAASKLTIRVGHVLVKAKTDRDRWIVDWLNSVACDEDNRSSIRTLVKIYVQSILVCGEVLVVRMPNPDSPVGFRIMLVDTARLMNPINRMMDDRIIGGVEYDARGKVTAYHIREESVGFSVEYRTIRVPVADAYLGYITERPGQRRGIPFHSAAATAINDLAHFQTANLRATTQAARLGVGFTGGDKVPDVKRWGRDTLKFVPGQWTPFMLNNRQMPQYGEYNKGHVNLVAGVTGVPAWSMLGTPERASYSSTKASAVDVCYNVNHYQDTTIFDGLAPVLDRWIRSGAAMFGREVAQGVEWVKKPFESMDPAKEAAARSTEMSTGQVLPDELYGGQGYTVDEAVERFLEAKKKFEAAGLRFPFLDEGKGAA